MSNHPATKIQAPIDPSTGLPGVGFKRYYYETGTTNAKNTYYNADRAGGHENANPTVSNASGYYPETYLLGDAAYTIVEKNADGETLWSTDGIWADTLVSGDPIAVTSSSATPAVSGTNSSSGPAGYFKNTGTGHAVWAEGDTSTPQKAAVHVVPQDTDPSVPVKGDLYVLQQNGTLRAYNGSTFDRYNARRYIAATTETKACDNFFTGYTFPSAHLNVVGCSIRVRAYATVSAQVANPDVKFDIYIGGTSLTAGAGMVVTAAAVGDRFELDARIVITAASSTGTLTFGHTSHTKIAATGVVASSIYSITGFSIDTSGTSALQLKVTKTGGTSASVDLHLFVVDFA